jgi:hypothetical protein
MGGGIFGTVLLRIVGQRTGVTLSGVSTVQDNDSLLLVVAFFKRRLRRGGSRSLFRRFFVTSLVVFVLIVTTILGVIIVLIILAVLPLPNSGFAARFAVSRFAAHFATTLFAYYFSSLLHMFLHMLENLLLDGEVFGGILIFFEFFAQRCE